ncbi:LINE-1 retrotransposable element ORF2 protein [Linum perenne]
MKDGFDDIAEIAVNFYKKLLGQSTTVNVEDIPNIIKRTLTPEQSDSLISDVSEEEIRKALISIADGKAPGPDGYNAYFFKHSWDIVKGDLFAAVRSFFSKSKMPGYVNSILLALIPKKFNAANMKDYRPIACCNVVYKIVSKVLANRLQAVLPSLINPAQTAFIKGRSIGDGILLAHELLRTYNRTGISPRCAMKIDLMKAFDSVEWTFIEVTLEAMQFPKVYIGWIIACFTSTMLSININGTSRGYFPAQRGLRQGDPISPYLFIISMEVLSCLFERASADKKLQYHPQCKGVQVTHLSFADDLLVFTKANVEAVEEIKMVLDKFHKCSGLRFNPEKSNIYIAGVSCEEEEEIIKTSGFLKGTLPFRYLGVPLTSGKLRKCDCKALIDSITARVTDWHARKLSYAGKCQLIDSVIGGKLQYWMTHFVLPSGVIKEVEQICNAFLWGKAVGEGKAKVAWYLVALPKEEGGVGLRDMRSWNYANVARHIWSLLMKVGSLWVAWIGKYRLKGRDFWEVKSTVGSWHWTKLLKLRSKVRQYFDIDADGDVMWKGTYMPKFRVSKVWNDIRPTAPKVKWYEAVWKDLSIPRRSFITWLIVIDRVATKDKIKRWSPNIAAECELCGNAEESREHLFAECGYVNLIFSTLLPEMNGKNWGEVIDYAAAWTVGAKVKKLIWRSILALIWEERCRRVFTQMRRTEHQLMDIIREEIIAFAGGSKYKSEILLAI